MKPFVSSRYVGRGQSPRRHCVWKHFAAFVAWVPQLVFAQAGDSIEGSSWWLGPIGVVLLLGACALAVVHVLRQRRMQLGYDSDLPRVLGTTSLGARERVVVLRANGRVFLLGVTAHQVTMLAELDQEPRIPQAPTGKVP